MGGDQLDAGGFEFFPCLIEIVLTASAMGVDDEDRLLGERFRFHAAITPRNQFGSIGNE